MYDHNDYLANPGKYRLFKTAKIQSNVINADGETTLAKGQTVGIKWRCEAVNPFYQSRSEPVFYVYVDGKYVGHDLYASALEDFVL